MIQSTYKGTWSKCLYLPLLHFLFASRRCAPWVQQVCVALSERVWILCRGSEADLFIVRLQGESYVVPGDGQGSFLPFSFVFACWSGWWRNHEDTCLDPKAWPGGENSEFPSWLCSRWFCDPGNISSPFSAPGVPSVPPPGGLVKTRRDWICKVFTRALGP